MNHRPEKCVPKPKPISPPPTPSQVSHDDWVSKYLSKEQGKDCNKCIENYHKIIMKLLDILGKEERKINTEKENKNYVVKGTI